MSSKKRTREESPETNSEQLPQKKRKFNNPFEQAKFTKSKKSVQNTNNNANIRQRTASKSKFVSTPKTSKSKNESKSNKKESQATRTTLEAWKLYKTKYNIHSKLFKYNTSRKCINCKECGVPLWTGKTTKFPKLTAHANNKHPEKIQTTKQQNKEKANAMVGGLNKKKNSKHRTGLRITFFCAFFIAALIQPMWLLESLVIFLHYFAVQNTTLSYACDGSRGQIFSSIAEAFRRRLKSNIRKSPFVGFAIDESTDKGTIKNLIIYICWWNWDTFECEESFIKLHEFDHEPTGKDIGEIVINVLMNEYGFTQEQIITSAMDGASVMMGKHKVFDVIYH
eukprot:443832_1